VLTNWLTNRMGASQDVAGHVDRAVKRAVAAICDPDSS
jgi:hypothetical protein